MKVTVLGTANAWGPNLFSSPPAPWPMAGKLSTGVPVEIRRYRTSLLVEGSDGKRILVDCGPDFAHQLREFRLGLVDAILITHPHFDHVGGLDEISLYRSTGRLPIPAYATVACWDCIKNDRGFGYVVGRLVSENRLFPPSGKPSFSIGSVTVTPVSVEHHASIAPGAVGFVFEESVYGQTKRVLYTGDLWAFSNPGDPLFKSQFDCVIMECDRWDGLAGPAVGGGHMSFREAVRLLSTGALSAPKPKQLVFVHFGDDGPKGLGSTYRDWRDNIIGELTTAGLAGVIPHQDKVVGYEGLTL